jgi:hypothetical protein
MSYTVWILSKLKQSIASDLANFPLPVKRYKLERYETTKPLTRNF